VLTWREPHGVTGHIIPWNYPLQIFGRSVGGRSPRATPAWSSRRKTRGLSLLRVAELAVGIGLPEGALNIVTGLGREAGAALAAHRGIEHLSFTGSPATGAWVAAEAAKRHCPVTLELGGKGPQIVFADADLDTALPVIVNAIIQNAGQTCSAAAACSWSARATRRCWQARRVLCGAEGRPALADLDCGPLIRAGQLERVRDFLRTRSATASPPWPKDDRRRRAPTGYYVAPHLLRDVAPSSRLACEEVFGPVLAAMPFVDEADAVRLANATDFGLVAGVWTADGGRQLRMARAIESGQVFIQQLCAGGGVELPSAASSIRGTAGRRASRRCTGSRWSRRSCCSMDDTVAIQPTFLLIADIAGYARFMKFHRASLAHAQEIVAQLLEAVIDATQSHLKLASSRATPHSSSFTTETYYLDLERYVVRFRQVPRCRSSRGSDATSSPRADRCRRCRLGRSLSQFPNVDRDAAAREHAMNASRLQNKIAIVTGAGSGFGAASRNASRRRAQGSSSTTSTRRVRSAWPLGIVAAGGTATFCAGDVSRDADVEPSCAARSTPMRPRHRRQHAGTTHRNQPLLDVAEEEFDRIYRVNVKSLFLTARHAVPHFRKKKSGVFITIASTAGVRRARDSPGTTAARARPSSRRARWRPSSLPTISALM